MQVFAPNQTGPQETRVALTPTAVKKLIDTGHCVSIESGAGRLAHHDDEEYRQAGATVIDDASAYWSKAELILLLAAPTTEQTGAIQAGAVVLGVLAPIAHPQIMTALANRSVTVFSMELMPRISRAQSMDALSSQASIAGYKAAILAANHCPKMYPMMMTPSGTIAPARVFVLGAGVAGLQAIATSKRLGAVVEAYDVRAATREQIQSLGARFVEMDTASQDDAATGGYAKQQTEAQRQNQIERMTKHVASSDVVIATAAVFGKAPPLLVPTSMVERMKPGSVIVDMAASAQHGRGNCELTRPGEIITTDAGVTLIGLTNLPALAPTSASQMLATNLINFIAEITHNGALNLNIEDQLHTGPLVAHEGKIVHELVLAATKEQ